jgi:Putative prokaryotic signal transducing protein
MKELFREPDYTRVSYYKAVLEQSDIPTIIRNEHLAGSGLTEIPIPEFFPALCVLHDEDYVHAVKIIREHLTTDQKNMDLEIICPSCGEVNPGNFELCWSCGNELLPIQEIV